MGGGVRVAMAEEGSRALGGGGDGDGVATTTVAEGSGSATT